MTTEELKVRDLNRDHIGRKVVVEGEGFTVCDVLARVAHEGKLYEDTTFMSLLPSYAIGRVTSHLDFLHSREVACTGEEKVTLLNP